MDWKDTQDLTVKYPSPSVLGADRDDRHDDAQRRFPITLDVHIISDDHEIGTTVSKKTAWQRLTQARET